MTDLFKSKPIIPEIMKEMGIYGDYILEARGDEYSQKYIINAVKFYNQCVYSDVCRYGITNMKNWNYTILGKDWWRKKTQVFESLLKSKYDKHI